MTTNEYLQNLNERLMQELVRRKEAMPPGFNEKRFALNSVTMIQDMMKDSYKLKNLMTVDLDSVVMCLIKGAYLGLDFFNGECYAIPYGPGRKAVADAERNGRKPPAGKMQFQTDYKGELKLCKKYSKNKIKDIFAKVVREGDDFYEEVDGGVQKIYFKPRTFSNAGMIGAFAIATFQDGSMIYETMSKEEIESVRQNYSKAKDSDAWLKSTGEMYKKTVLRRLCKLIDLNFDNIEQQQAFEDGGDATFTGIADGRQQQLALPEREQPIDVSEQIRNMRKKEYVPANPQAIHPEAERQVSEPVQASVEEVSAESEAAADEYADFDQRFMEMDDIDAEMPFM